MESCLKLELHKASQLPSSRDVRFAELVDVEGNIDTRILGYLRIVQLSVKPKVSVHSSLEIKSFVN